MPCLPAILFLLASAGAAPRFTDLETWRRQARGKVEELLLIPDMPWKPEVRIERQFEFDGLHVEELSWQLPYGPPTRAVFMKPADSRGRLPAVLALHDPQPVFVLNNEDDVAAPAAGAATGLARTQRLLAEKKPVRVVAYGDSISEVKPGWNGGAKTPDANWAAVLARRLGERYPGSDFTLRHFAIGGQNTSEGLGRLDGLEPLAPDLVLVAFGANDCCHHFLEPVETGQALATLVANIRTRFDADVVVVGTGGDNPRKPFFRHLDATLATQQAAAAEAGVPFVDMRAAILAATAGGDRWAEFHLAADNCHPNDAGHGVWAEAALRAIEAGLQKKDRHHP